MLYNIILFHMPYRNISTDIIKRKLRLIKDYEVQIPLGQILNVKCPLQ